MQNGRSSVSTLLTLCIFCTMLIAASSAGATTECAGGSKASPAQASSEESLNILLELKDASVAKGVELRVSFNNEGPGAVSLSVCPAMLLCCVKGLHPLVTCQSTGVGLLDVCRVANPTSHEVYLPVNSTFSFDMNVPPERLLPGCVEKGKKISVCVCYELDETRVIHSNNVEATMK